MKRRVQDDKDRHQKGNEDIRGQLKDIVKEAEVVIAVMHTNQSHIVMKILLMCENIEGEVDHVTNLRDDRQVPKIEATKRNLASIISVTHHVTSPRVTKENPKRRAKKANNGSEIDLRIKLFIRFLILRKLWKLIKLFFHYQNSVSFTVAGSTVFAGVVSCPL